MTEKIPLLLLPGLLCDEALWRPQVEGLADIAVPRVADLTQDDSLPGMARRVLSEAPDRFALAGLSMGGYLAQEIMREAGDRVMKLALLDTSARADTPEQAARRRGLIELSHKGEFKGVTPRLFPIWVHPARSEDAPLMEIVAGMARHVGKDGFLRQQTAIMGRPDGREDLRRIGIPTLVLCGRQDAATPLALHEEIAGLVPGARFVVIEDCGHLSTLEKPVSVTTALRQWLLE
ncbi:MAG TPA: alpha/beta fold hydrolase [Stellaceae bacterium]|nr:alpha/beta fold hydrolase [Stellaceae bacterium]